MEPRGRHNHQHCCKPDDQFGLYFNRNYQRLYGNRFANGDGEYLSNTHHFGLSFLYYL